MTLNIAHGRSDGPNQIFLATESFKQNLAAVGALLEASRADVVALQEVDGPSRWSGNFDHAAVLAAGARYPWFYRADHARTWLYRYGTAVLSRLPQVSASMHRFAPSPPTPRKGFVVSQISVPLAGLTQDSLDVDVVSVHFDFLSRRARREQLAELLTALDDGQRPSIVLGDFNSDWQASGSVVRALTDRTRLRAYEPEAPGFGSHEGRRIDWILATDDFRFEDYRVLPDRVSDHRAVVAELGIDPAGPLADLCGD